MKEIATVLPKEGVNVRASLDPIDGPGPKVGTLKHGDQIEVGERRGTNSFWWRRVTFGGRPESWICECRKDDKAVYLSIEQIPDAPAPRMPPPADYDPSPLGDNDLKDWPHDEGEPSEIPVWLWALPLVIVAATILAWALLG